MSLALTGSIQFRLCDLFGTFAGNLTVERSYHLIHVNKFPLFQIKIIFDRVFFLLFFHFVCVWNCLFFFFNCWLSIEIANKRKTCLQRSIIIGLTAYAKQYSIPIKCESKINFVFTKSLALSVCGATLAQPIQKLSRIKCLQ